MNKKIVGLALLGMSVLGACSVEGQASPVYTNPAKYISDVQTITESEDANNCGTLSDMEASGNACIAAQTQFAGAVDGIIFPSTKEYTEVNTALGKLQTDANFFHSQGCYNFTIDLTSDSNVQQATDCLQQGQVVTTDSTDLVVALKAINNGI